MSLSTATISYDISDLVGADFDSRRTKVWVTTNVEGDTIIDTVGNAIRVGDGLGTVAEDGTGSVAVWIPGTGSNPDSWQTTVHLDYAPRRPGAARVQRAFGPFTVSASANLADLVEEQEVPPTYMSAAVAQLQALVDQAVEITGIATVGQLKVWARNLDLLIVGAITRDSNGAATAAPVKWPDGTVGTYAADTLSSAFLGAVDAYHVTYGSPVTRTVTQPAVTRDVSGAVTNLPDLVVS